jgi:hypothetical protein
MRWRSVSRTACSGAVVAAAVAALAGCGDGSERLPVVTALRLSRLAGDVAAGRGCGTPVLRATIAAVNGGEVPEALQEQLVSDANRIAASCSRPRARKLAERLEP